MKLLRTFFLLDAIFAALFSFANIFFGLDVAAFEIRAAGSPFEARPSFFDFAASIEKNFDKAFGLY